MPVAPPTARNRTEWSLVGVAPLTRCAVRADLPSRFVPKGNTSQHRTLRQDRLAENLARRDLIAQTSAERISHGLFGVGGLTLDLMLAGLVLTAGWPHLAETRAAPRSLTRSAWRSYALRVRARRCGR